MELEFVQRPASLVEDDTCVPDVEALDADAHAAACAKHVHAFCAYARTVHQLDVRGPRLLLSCNPAAPYTWGLVYVHAAASAANGMSSRFFLFASDLVGPLAPDAHRRIRFPPLLAAVRAWNAGKPTAFITLV
jgi:hypothetical protein